MLLVQPTGQCESLKIMDGQLVQTLTLFVFCTYQLDRESSDTVTSHYLMVKLLFFKMLGRGLLLLSYIIISSLTFSQCSGPDYIDPTGNLVGTVRDARTNEPVSGASVTLTPSGKSSTTGQDGRYEFMGIEPDSYQVQVQKAYYQSDNKSAVVNNQGATTTVDFQLTPATGQLNCSQSLLDFGHDVTNLPVEISNTGVAALKWQLAENAAWLTCNPTSGTTHPGEKSTVVVTVDRKGLDRGTYSNAITISSEGGGSAVVNVKMTVFGITVGVNPEQLDFGSIESSITLSLTNQDSGNVTYSLEKSNEWIGLSKTGGTFSKTETISVTVNRTGLAQGDYTGSLNLIVGDNKQTIPVRMNVAAKEKPLVSTYAVASVSYNTAEFKGSVLKLGSSAVKQHGFCWSAFPTPTVSSEGFCNLGDLGTPHDFSYEAKNLAPSTVYYVRAYAENSDGLSYGEEVSFTTRGTPQLSTVSTGKVSEVIDRSASVEGVLESLGNVDEVLAYGHVWSTLSNPTVSGSKTDLGKTSKTGPFKSALSDLVPGTVYYVRAYATNSVGTAYGQEVTVRTSSSNNINIEGYGNDIKWIP